MDLRFGVFSFTLLLASIIMRYIGGLTWSRRNVIGATYYTFLMFSTALWAFAGSFEAASVTVPMSIFWSKVSYIGIVFTGPMWFLFSLEYSQKNKFLGKKFQNILVGISAIFLSLVLTNEWHHTVWPTISKVALENGDIVTKYGHGVTFYANMVYQYLMILLGVGLLLKKAIEDPESSATDKILNSCAILFPVFGNAIYIFNPALVSYYDITPLIFAISGGLVLISIYRFQFYQGLVEIQELVLKNIGSGMVLLNSKNDIVEMNDTASSLFEDSIGVGTNINDMPKEIQDKFCCDDNHGPFYFKHLKKWYETKEQVVPLLGQRKKGKLVTFSDVTEINKYSEQIAESRHLLYTIIDFFPDVIFAVDKEGKIILWNKEAERTTGVKGEDIMGTKSDILSQKVYGKTLPFLVDFVLEDNPRKMAKIQSIKKTGDILTLFGTYNEREYWYIAKPLYDADGAVIGAIQTARDVTEQMRGERELQERVNTLMKLNDIMIKREERISQLTEEVKTLRTKHAKP